MSIIIFNGEPRPTIFELELTLSDIYVNHSNYSFVLRKSIFFPFQQISLKVSSSSNIEGLGPPFMWHLALGFQIRKLYIIF